jgi:hypothetical protein
MQDQTQDEARDQKDGGGDELNRVAEKHALSVEGLRNPEPFGMNWVADSGLA